MTLEKTQETGDVETVYEVSYLLLPSLAKEQVPSVVASLKNVLTSIGGKILTDEDPILIDLAYPMKKVVQTVRHKVTTGYFGWIKFEMTAEGIGAVKKNLDAHADVLRYIIIKTVRENTLLNGKMRLQKDVLMPPGDRIKKTEDDVEVLSEPAKEVVPEEIDKSIDDLVIA